jgi:hypothetical protein
MIDVAVIMPVFNDWESAQILLGNAEAIFKKDGRFNPKFILVNDFSLDEAPEDFVNCISYEVLILNLIKNVGHQRAIVLGLCYINENYNCEHVVVIDADGEDKPEDIIVLLDTAIKENGKIIFAKRSNRYEAIWFQIFYFFYKAVFKILTGKQINFGNFCAIPFKRLKNLIYVSELWNHFSVGVVRSKTPFYTVPLSRGKRYKGKSKMNFINLVIHGLSAISVFTDVLAVRILLFSIILIANALLAIFIVAGIRLFTDLAIPGWASSIILGMTIVIIQAFLISLFLVFSVLNYRTQQSFIPAYEYKKYIADKC